MIRKIYNILLSLLLVVCLVFGISACYGSREIFDTDETLDKDNNLKHEHVNMNDVFYSQYGTDFIYDEFYGVYDDAQSFFVASDATAIKCVSIGGNIFKYFNLWEIYLYKDAKFYKLKEAYLAGVLSSQSVYDLSKVHAKYVQTQLNANDDVFNAWYYNTEDIQDIVN